MPLLFSLLHFQALDKCQLGGLVREKEMRLNSPGLVYQLGTQNKTLN